MGNQSYISSLFRLRVGIMAAAVRTLKTVRPHIPMIKFPLRGKAPEMNPATSAAPVTSANPPTATTTASKPIGSTPSGSGIDYLNLPAKYKRKLLSVEEMEFIEKGGPV